MREIFIHIGPHKTGTKSLQSFLRDNLDIIQTQYHVPISSVISKDNINHANLFWELSEPKDIRFNENIGNYDQFLTEIKNSSKNVLLSSEAFSFIFTDAKLYTKIISDLKKLNFKINLIIFLRNDIFQFNSLYNLLMKSNHTNQVKKYSFFYSLFNLFISGKIKNYMFNQVGNYYFYISHKLLIKDIKSKSVDVKILEIKFNKNFIENFLKVLKLNKKDFFLNKIIHKNRSEKKTPLVFIGFFFYLKNLFHF